MKIRSSLHKIKMVIHPSAGENPDGLQMIFRIVCEHLKSMNIDEPDSKDIRFSSARLFSFSEMLILTHGRNIPTVGHSEAPEEEQQTSVCLKILETVSAN